MMYILISLSMYICVHIEMHKRVFVHVEVNVQRLSPITLHLLLCFETESPTELEAHSYG